MGIKICPDCNGKVSESAAVCPHCGRGTIETNTLNRNRGCGDIILFTPIIIIILIVMFFVARGC
jgi:ribosomal protein L40E